MYLEWQELIVAFRRRHRKDPGLQGFLYFMEEYANQLETQSQWINSQPNYYPKRDRLKGHRERI